MTSATKTIAAAGGGLLIVVAITATVTVVIRSPEPAPPAAAKDGPVNELAEKELEMERQAQADRKAIQEGNRKALDAMRAKQTEQDKEGVFSLGGGRAEYERRQEEDRQKARLAKAKANGFDTWDAYQQHLQTQQPTTTTTRGGN